MKINFSDNSKEILYKFAKARERGLEAIGMTAEGYAKKELGKAQKHAKGPDRPYIDTGRLRNSISHASQGNDVYIGTNVEYAPWVELGTGIYASDGQGRKDVPWVYQDAEGKWHSTSGIMPVHFLKKAATEHGDEYKELMEKSMKNG